VPIEIVLWMAEGPADVILWLVAGNLKKIFGKTNTDSHFLSVFPVKCA
jgi:hypothetical protein